MIASLDSLNEGFPAISKSIGQFLAEGAAFCLESNGHKSGIQMVVSGTYDQNLQLEWGLHVDSQVKRSWNDLQEATEYGAVGIALILLKKLTHYTVIERSFKGTHFDYWLGTGEYDENLLPFEQRKAKLEVSGIWKASKSNTLEARTQIKLRQIRKSLDEALPAIVIVVEFGTPASKIVVE